MLKDITQTPVQLSGQHAAFGCNYKSYYIISLLPLLLLLVLAVIPMFALLTIIPECVAKGSRFTLWGSGWGGVFAGRRFGVRNRSHTFAHDRGGRKLRCLWEKLQKAPF